MTFADDLKKAQAAKLPSQDVPVLLAGKIHTLRFFQMNGLEWASETDKYPPRLDTTIDSTYGYNIRELTRGVAPLCGVRLEGDLEMHLDDAEWAALFASISGHDFQKLTDAIWDLNEYGPQTSVSKALEALKKAPGRSGKRSA